MSRIHPHTHESLAEGGKLDPSGALRGGLSSVGGGSSGGGSGGDPGNFVTKDRGGLETLEAHGSAGSTETIDIANGNWHSLTLSADCTITVVGFTAAVGCSILVKVTQDGTGGWAIVWDADIVFASGVDDQPSQGIGDVSWFILASDEGDGTIYGFPVGGAGSTLTFGTPAIVLGTAAAAGSTDEVIRRDSTIVAFDATVPVTQAFSDAAATGSAAVAARRDHVHGMPATPSGGSGGHMHVVSENHLSNGSATTYTLDQAFEVGSVIAWNTTTLARLGVTEAQPDQATVSAAGTTGDTIMFDYAATVV